MAEHFLKLSAGDLRDALRVASNACGRPAQLLGKATAIHVLCLQGRFRGAARLARYWHDIARLDEFGHAAQAFADGDIARAVARHKAVFFPEKTPEGEPLDYMAAVTGGLRLAPEGQARRLLAEDYRRMADDGLYPNEAAPFEASRAQCGRIEQRVNKPAS